MSKNMTRKGLAIGTASALVITGLIGTPAFAGGLADKTFVSLTPTTGTAYTVLTGASKTFSLTANEATSVAGAGRNVKFLVTDSASAIEPTTASVGRTALTVDQTSGSNASAVGSTDVVTVIQNGSGLQVGERITFAEPIRTAGTVLQAANVSVEVTAVTGTTSFAFKASGDVADLSSTILAGNDSAVKVLREARDSAGSYVVNSGSATDTANEVLILSTSSTEDSTRSVTVEAWVDANGNDIIDGTEYASPVRTVTFQKASEITGTVTWTVPTLGDTTLKASVVTTPELNGSQMSTNDVTVQFTRQGSTASLTAAQAGGSTTWDSTNKDWDATANTALSSAGTPWTGLADTNDNDVVFAGTYTARPFIGSTALAAAVSVSVGSTQAGDVKAVVVATANNAGAENEAETASSNAGATVTVRKGSSVTVTATIFDNSNPAKKVGAGIPVTGTLSGTTGTIRVNGVATSNQQSTNANGEVTFVVSTNTNLTSDAAVLTINAQNVTTSGTQARFTFDWQDPTVTLYDSSVANAASSVNRSVAKNGSVSFNFRIADQWAQALAGTYRLKIANTGNTVSTNYVSVVGGAATVTVADGQIGAGSSISTAVDVERDVSGTWTAQTLTTGGTTLAYTTSVLDQTDSVVITDPTVVSSANISTKATAAIDTRASNAAITVAGQASATVAGLVRHATTAAARGGALVTVTGTSDMLFNTGGVYAFGSITFRAASDGTFSVAVFSNKAQKETVVTVTSNGATGTKKVTFTVPNNLGAKTMTITAPDSVQPGSTFRLTGKLVDEFGNGLDTAAADNSSNARFSVTYTGPGIVFGSLPTETDANGEFSFVVLLGTNDKGSATVVASYDYDGTGTVYTAAAGSKTITVGASTAGKVNVGSFNGKLVVYAANLNGARISWKVGGNWGTGVASSNYSIFNRPTPRAGATVSVDIYVNGVKTLTKSVVTR